MTDKEQIIIDGVDVGECNFFNNITENHYCLGIPCKDRPYCYFKQLQKEKFENLNNRQMVKNAENLINENSKLYKNLKEKEQECEELKNKLARQININNQLIDYQVTANKLRDCYLKALDEIEEIAKGMRSVFIGEISITASQLNDRIYQETTARFQQILNIINKVKGE